VDACFAGEPGLGTEVVVEELLEGPEASLFCLCDGTRAVLFGTAEDHKRAFDGDEGPNTGGMGAYSPALALTTDLVETAMARIVRPTLDGMREAGSPFSGILYAGLMMTAEGPKLIEYNVRFGDPECQTLMMRLDDDLLPILLAVAKGDLSSAQPKWRDEAAVCVVMAAKGYPGSYAKGSEIGLPKETAPDAVVFQAGTRQDGERLLADGGRVLGVTALGADVGQARSKAYELVRAVDWGQGFFRSDIAHRAVSKS
jgi:phosphoribosylamine--glycine ligase